MRVRLVGAEILLSDSARAPVARYRGIRHDEKRVFAILFSKEDVTSERLFEKQKSIYSRGPTRLDSACTICRLVQWLRLKDGRGVLGECLRALGLPSTLYVGERKRVGAVEWAGTGVEPLMKDDDDLPCLALPRTRNVRETCVIDRLSLAVCGDQSQSRVASTQCRA
jgi:hypothetical protein